VVRKRNSRMSPAVAPLPLGWAAWPTAEQKRERDRLDAEAAQKAMREAAAAKKLEKQRQKEQDKEKRKKERENKKKERERAQRNNQDVDDGHENERKPRKKRRRNKKARKATTAEDLLPLDQGQDLQLLPPNMREEGVGAWPWPALEESHKRVMLKEEACKREEELKEEVRLFRDRLHKAQQEEVLFYRQEFRARRGNNAQTAPDSSAKGLSSAQLEELQLELNARVRVVVLENSVRGGQVRYGETLLRALQGILQDARYQHLRLPERTSMTVRATYRGAEKSDPPMTSQDLIDAITEEVARLSPSF